MIDASTRHRPRPLLSVSGLCALIGGSVLLLGVFLPLAQGRLTHAMQLAPSSLSLRYLELSLAKRPDDSSLRMDLVHKLLQTGQLTRARSTLSPLTAAGSQHTQTARLLLIEVDRRAWAALDPRRASERDAARLQVLTDLRAIDTTRLAPREAEPLAQLYRDLDQPLAAAALLDALARRDPQASTDTADAAWLSAGLPARAALLHADLALRPGQPPGSGLAHARRAIALMRSAGEPRDTTRLVERLRAGYPNELGLLELAIQVAEEHDTEHAYELAKLLLQRAPHEPKYWRWNARLAEATGHSLRALDAYMWLVRHGGDATDHTRALALARSNWDLPLVRELLDRTAPAQAPAGELGPMRKPLPKRLRHEGGPRASVAFRRTAPRCQATRKLPPTAARVSALEQLVALDEALGDVSAARGRLTTAVAGDLAHVSAVWQRKLELEQRASDWAAQLDTAARMLERFPSRAASERLAAIQLALGQTQAALHTLLSAPMHPDARDEAWLQRIAQLAFEAGDSVEERAAYEQLVRRPNAAAWEYQRLWELAPDADYALRIARAAFERFESPDMLAAALEVYRMRGADAEDDQLALLERAETSATIRVRAEYWQTRVSLLQRRAARLTEARHYAAAKQQLGAAQRVLARARTSACQAESAAICDRLGVAMQAQTLALGLASDDTVLMGRAYAEYGSHLTVRERVYVLRRLGRQEDALSLTRTALEARDLSEADQRALEADARDLSAGRARYLRVSGDAVQLDGLRALQSSATLEYAEQNGGLRGEASVTQYEPRDGVAAGGLSGTIRDVSGSLSGRLGRATLELGLRVRQERDLRPFGALGIQLSGKPGAGMLARLQVNDLSADTARLRVLALRQAVVLDTATPLTKHVYVSARTAAESFHRRADYAYLGAGITVDANLGANFKLPLDAGLLGVRVSGRAAPRFAHTAQDKSGWLPGHSGWTGVGASIGSGDLDVPPLLGRRFHYLLDGALGVLWPDTNLGFSAQARLAVSVFGADLLSVGARGSNVVGNNTLWSANVSYGITLDR